MQLELNTAGLREVSGAEFFAALKADKRDIMPTVEHPDHTDWLCQRTRQLFGRSFPGWRNTTGNAESYWLTPDA